MTYYNVWKNFNQFLVRLDRMPKLWEERLSLYCTFLITIKKRKSATIKSYISGIKHILKTDGYEWDDGKALLNTLTKSCKLKNDKLKVRLPIQKGLLELILFRIQRKYQNQPFLEALFITAYLLLYYGLLRVGEVAESQHSIKAINVHEAQIGSHKRLLLVLYTSKTHGRDSQPQKIKIFDNKSLEIIDETNAVRSYGYSKNKDGVSYFVPSVDRETRIDGIKKWEQAFRVYTTIYCQANPTRAGEILQYIDIIHRAASIFNWDNVAKYDYVFRQLMATKPHRSWAKVYTQMWNLTLNEPIKKFHENNNYHGNTSSNANNRNQKKKDNICWKYNKNNCTYGRSCKFEHKCSYCGVNGHPVGNCHKKQGKRSSGDKTDKGHKSNSSASAN